MYAPAIKVKSSTMRNPDNLCIRRKTATVQGTPSHGHGLSTFWKIQLKLICLDWNIITLNANHFDTSWAWVQSIPINRNAFNSLHHLPALPALPARQAGVLVLHSGSVEVESVLTARIAATPAAAHKAPNTNRWLCGQQQQQQGVQTQMHHWNYY